MENLLFLGVPILKHIRVPVLDTRSGNVFRFSFRWFKKGGCQAMGFFQGTQEQVRNSHGKRAISVRATEGLL